MRPYQAILVLETLASQMSGPICRDGQPLIPTIVSGELVDDRATVVDVYLQWICLLLDLGYLPICSLRRDAARLLEDLFSKDVLDLNQAMTEILFLVRDQEHKGFKRLCSRISRHLYNIVKDDIVKSAKGDVIAAKRLVQLFSYTGRLSLRGIDLTTQCVRGYLDVESGIPESFPDDLIRDMNLLIRSWIKAFDPSNLSPCHGPGGVADVPSASLEQKYRFLSTDQLLEYAYGEPLWVHAPGDPVKRISKTIFVPKSYKTFRVISLEPATLQYLQQGVWKEIDRIALLSPYLRRHIDFHDEERNRRLARIGSRKRNYATIDLSAASDSVSYKLVKLLFKGTKLLPFLMATRSRETKLPTKGIVALKKFAPSGSALCFPVETLIFAAACQLVTQIHGVSGNYSCYGDDLIIPTQCVGDLVNVLIALGFSVNRSKSYFLAESWFRESCGGEFCDGYDVTPIRVSRKYTALIGSEGIDSLVQLANAAHGREFWFLRSYFVRKILGSRYKVVFGTTALLSDDDTNYHLKQRWNKGLQVLEVRASVQTVRYSRSDELIRYRHWLEHTSHRNVKAVDKWGYYHPYVSWDDDFFESRVGRPTVIVKDAWVHKPYNVHDQDVYDQYALMRRYVFLQTSKAGKVVPT